MLIFGKPRYLGIVSFPEEHSPENGEQWVVQSARGKELAIVAGPISPEQEQFYREAKGGENQDGTARGGEPPLQDLQCLEPATEDDICLAEDQRDDENVILQRSREILRNHNLAMKLVDVEFLLDRKKLFFYFTAEQRIDFRAFVRDLAREFRTRIELRQIGIRDEAKVVEGLAPCGKPCCCSYWLNRFAPICIRMVKEQNLALNPTKISGLCGRLMCCMSYEHKTYRNLWENLPNPGSKIRAPQGTFILAGVDVHAEAVRIYTPDRSELLVPVDRFKEFRATVMEGKAWEPEPAIEQEKVFATAMEIPSLKESLGKRPEKTPSEGKKRRKRPTRPPKDSARKAVEEEKMGVPAESETPKKRPPRKRKRRKKKAPETAGAPEKRTETKPQRPPAADKEGPGPDDKSVTRKRPPRRRKRKKSPKASPETQNKKEEKN